MAKKKEKVKELNPEKLPKPPGDTSANEGVDGKPPPTWDPGKVTQPLETNEDT